MISEVVEHSRLEFDKPPSLKVLEPLLIAIYEESKSYQLWPVSLVSIGQILTDSTSYLSEP
jgi:hypothetical protein